MMMLLLMMMTMMITKMKTNLDKWSDVGGGGGGIGDAGTSRIDEAGAQESDTRWPARGRVHEV